MELVSPMYFNMVAWIAALAGLAIGGWLVTALYAMRSRREEARSSKVDLPEGIQEGSARVPPAMVAFYIFVVVVMIAYVVYNWLMGVSY